MEFRCVELITSRNQMKLARNVSRFNGLKSNGVWTYNVVGHVRVRFELFSVGIFHKISNLINIHYAV